MTQQRWHHFHDLEMILAPWLCRRLWKDGQGLGHSEYEDLRDLWGAWQDPMGGMDMMGPQQGMCLGSAVLRGWHYPVALHAMFGARNGCGMLQINPLTSIEDSSVRQCYPKDEQHEHAHGPDAQHGHEASAI